MKKLTIAILTGIMMLTATGCGDLTTPIPSSYKTMTYQDVSFGIPQTFVDTATVISALNEDFANNESYIYENENEYMFFNMNSIIVICEKGTNFGDDATSDSICDAWFTPTQKKWVKEKKDSYIKKEIPATCEISITKTLYGSYVGKLTTLSDGTNEYALYAGVVAPSLKEASSRQKDVIDNIVNTFNWNSFSSTTASDNPNAVVVEGVSEPEVETPVVEETTPAEPTTPKVSFEPRNAPIGNPLSVGEIGVCFTGIKSDQQLTANSFRVDKIYKDEEAISLLKNLLKEEYTSPREGTVWNVLEYSTEKSPFTDEGYINIKLRGFGGKPLTFRGVKYTKRTYDYLDNVKEDNVFSKCYCYYEVPVGCTEYLLEFGIHDNNIEGLKEIEGTYLLVE